VPRLLVVDDEEPILFALSTYFETAGFAVDCARDLAEASGLLCGGRYACVIADLCLGVSRNTEGLEVIRLVRQRGEATRVVLLSAYGSAETIAQATAAGADAFLHKPVRLGELLELVNGLVR
jgi:DNA-binding response OmpR family regulator